MRFFFVLIPCLFSFFSCKKAADRSCWKYAGEGESRTIALTDFNKIYIGPKIQLTLIQDTANFMEVIGFKNLNNKITSSVTDGELKIDNLNTCDFNRKYKYKSIPVRLHFKAINRIFSKATEDVRTEGVIQGNELDIEIQDGSGTLYLDINVARFNAVQGHGFGNYVVTGQCINSSQIINSNGYCNATGLTVSNQLVAINRSQVDCKFNIENTQNAILQTTGGGNLFYIGSALNLSTSELGNGKIIKVD